MKFHVILEIPADAMKEIGRLWTVIARNVKVLPLEVVEEPTLFSIGNPREFMEFLMLPWVSIPDNSWENQAFLSESSWDLEFMRIHGFLSILEIPSKSLKEIGRIRGGIARIVENWLSRLWDNPPCYQSRILGIDRNRTSSRCSISSIEMTRILIGND